MKYILSLLALIAGTTSFAPSQLSLMSRSFSLQSRSLSTSLSAASLSPDNNKPPSIVTRLVDPIYYPWNKARLAERTSRRLRREAALLYRQLGVSEQASYEEINAAYDTLVAKYATDIKRKMRLGVTKDKIMSIRLQQRVAGSLQVDGEAREMDIISDRIKEMSQKNKKFTPPTWTGGLMVMPDKAWAIKNR